MSEGSASLLASSFEILAEAQESYEGIRREFAVYQRCSEMKSYLDFDIDAYTERWNQVMHKVCEILCSYQKYRSLCMYNGMFINEKLVRRMDRPWLKDESMHHLWQVSMIIRHLFRNLFGIRLYNKWGFFLDRQMCRIIHEYSDYIDYCTEDSRLTGHTKAVLSLAVLNDGRYLFSGANDKKLLVWNLSTNKVIAKLYGRFGAVRCLDYRFGMLASGHGDSFVCVLDTYTLGIVQVFKEHTGSVYCVEFNQTGDTVISGSRDLTIRVWSVHTGECLRYFIGHTDKVYSVRFLGDVVISGSYDQSIKVWDPLTAKDVRTVTEGIHSKVTDIRINCDATLMACIVRHTSIVILSLPELNIIRTLPTSSLQARFHPSIPQLLAIGASFVYCVQLLDVISGKCVGSLLGHSRNIHSICFSSDGSRVISASSDESVGIWNVNQVVSKYLRNGDEIKCETIKLCPLLPFS